jgi:hypothetical protein
MNPITAKRSQNFGTRDTGNRESRGVGAGASAPRLSGLRGMDYPDGFAVLWDGMDGEIVQGVNGSE